MSVYKKIAGRLSANTADGQQGASSYGKEPFIRDVSGILGSSIIASAAASVIENNSKSAVEAVDAFRIVAEFVKNSSPEAAKSYLKAIIVTTEVSIMTDKRVVSFGLENPKICKDYFSMLSGICSTSERYNDFNLLDRGNPEDMGTDPSPVVLLGPLHNAGRGAIAKLTSGEVLELLGSLKNHGGTYLEAIWKTGMVDRLTEPDVIDFAKRLGVVGSNSYFSAITEAGTCNVLADKMVVNDRVADFARSLSINSDGYFHAMASKKAVEILTSDRIMANKSLDELRMNIGSDIKYYFNTVGNIENLGAYKGDFVNDFLEYLKKMNNTSSFFLRSLNRNENSLVYLLTKWVEYPERSETIVSKSLPLLCFHSSLEKMGVNADMETDLLIKRANRAEISRISELVTSRAFIATAERQVHFVMDAKKQGITTAESLDALKNLGIFVKIVTGLPDEMKKKLISDINFITFSNVLSEPEELKKAYPDIMEYIHRHTGENMQRHGGKASKVEKEEAMALLSACHLFNKRLSIPQVNAEKKRIARGEPIILKAGFERKFMEKLRKSAQKARFDALIEACNAHHNILSDISKTTRITPVEITDDIKDILEGYLNLRFNRRQFEDFLRVYTAYGKEYAVDWLRTRPGNVKAIKQMLRRGTDMEGVQNFEVSYRVEEMGDQLPKYLKAASRLSSEIKHHLKYFNINLRKDDIKTGDDLLFSASMALAAIPQLSAMKAELNNDQKILAAKLKRHINELNSMAGIVRAAMDGTTITFFASGDPIMNMRMGVWFQSCLDIKNGAFSYGAVARAFDANNVTIFAVKGEGKRGPVVGRVSLIESDRGFVVHSPFYQNPPYNFSRENGGWIDMLLEFAKKSNRDVLLPYDFAPEKFFKSALVKKGLNRKIEAEVNVSGAFSVNGYSDLGPEVTTNGANMSLLLYYYLLQRR